jgi:hypothetical protein
LFIDIHTFDAAVLVLVLVLVLAGIGAEIHKNPYPSKYTVTVVEAVQPRSSMIGVGPGSDGAVM